MELIRLICENKQYIFSQNLEKIDFEETIENENRLFVKIKTKYKTIYKSFCGKKITIPANCQIITIHELNFSLICKVFEFWNLDIKALYNSIEDHPFCVWRNNFLKKKNQIREKVTYSFYENAFLKMYDGSLPDFSKSDEFYERVSSLGSEDFFNFCVKFFEEDYLLYNTDFCSKCIYFFMKYNYSRENIRNLTSRWKDHWINSIEFSVIVIAPRNIDEYFQELNSLYFDFSNCTINSAKYIVMFIGYDSSIFLKLLDYNVNFNCLVDHCFFGEEFFENNFIDSVEKYVDDFYDFYIEYITRNYLYDRRTKVNISISNVLLFGENSYEMFLNYEKDYSVTLIIRTLKKLKIIPNKEKIKDLIIKLHLKNEQEKSIKKIEK